MEELLMEFIEACVHQILYQRGLYPPSIFAKRLLYNVPIMASQHDMVNEFISDHLKSVKLALQKPDSSMKQFEMIIIDDDESVVESYNFEISLDRNGGNVYQAFDVYKVSAEMEQQLRSCLLKLNARLSEIPMDPKLSETLTYNFRIVTTRAGAETLSSDTKWCAIAKTDSESRSESSRKRIIPVHCVTNDPFNLRLTIEL